MAFTDTNLNSLFNVTKQVVDGMIKKMGSDNKYFSEWAKRPIWTTIHSQLLIHGFSMSLAQELATKGNSK